MTDRSAVAREQHFRSKLTEENVKFVQYLSDFEQSKTVTPGGNTRNQKNIPSIYHLVEELKASNNDQPDVKIISGNSDDLWWRKGNFDEAKAVPKTKVRKSTNGKKHSEGDVPRRLEGTSDSPRAVGDGFGPTPKLPDDNVTGPTAVLPQKQKLRTSVESYQLLLEKRKEQIYSLQESMHDQNREMEALKRHLQDYQRQIAELRSKLAAAEKEMGRLRQTLGLERQMATNLKNTNESKLQMIEDLSKRLKSEEEKNRSLLDEENKLKVINKKLGNSLFTERDANKNLEREIEFKQAHIEELMARLRSENEQLEEIKRHSLGVKEAQRLQEELEMAREQVSQQTREREKTRVENENLKLLAGEQAAELREKAEIIDGLQHKVDDLRAANEKVDEMAKALFGKQNQLLAVNAKLMEANASLGKEKTHVQKTMAKLEATHKRVLIDLRTMLTTFRKQLIAKFKESEDLKRRLRMKETILAELVGTRFSTLSRRRSGVSRKNALRVYSPSSALFEPRKSSSRPHTYNWKKKIKHGSFDPLRDFIAADPKSSESSLRTLSDFTNSKSLQVPFGCSDRGDNSSVDGFESLCTTSTRRSPKRFETTTTLRKSCLRTTLKPLEECSNFLSHVNRHEMSKIRNVHVPFFNISPGLINLGVGHLINQMERIQKSSHRDFSGRTQNVLDNRLDLGINMSSFLPKNSGCVDLSLGEKEAELMSKRTSGGEASKSSPLWIPENDGTVFDMVSRLCSSLYDAVSKIVTENSV